MFRRVIARPKSLALRGRLVTLAFSKTHCPSLLFPSLVSSTRAFSHTAMVAQKIDGTAIAKSIRERLNSNIKQKQEKNPRYKPSLIIIQGMHLLFFSLVL